MTAALLAVRSNPRNAQAWLTLGYELLSRGEFAKARACFTYTLRYDPNLKEGYYALAALDLPPYATPQSWTYDA